MAPPGTTCEDCGHKYAAYLFDDASDHLICRFCQERVCFEAAIEAERMKSRKLEEEVKLLQSKVDSLVSERSDRSSSDRQISCNKKEKKSNSVWINRKILTNACEVYKDHSGRDINNVVDIEVADIQPPQSPRKSGDRIVGLEEIRVEGDNEGGWVEVKKGGRPILGRRASLVQCSNKFAPISDGRREESTKGTIEDTEVLLIGDSQVRYLDRNFCSGDKRKRTRVCLPGAKVNDIVERFDRLVKGCERNAVIVTHVGVNDIQDKRSEALFKSYSSLLEKMKESHRRCVISGILPRMNVGKEWLSRAIGMNTWLKGMCERVEYKDNISFVDGWDSFYSKRELYGMDGLHPSRQGVKVLGTLFENCLSGQGN